MSRSRAKHQHLAEKICTIGKTGKLHVFFIVKTLITTKKFFIFSDYFCRPDSLSLSLPPQKRRLQVRSPGATQTFAVL